ncbi:Gfo/Idh/MocA family protein [Alkalicoccobacillus murimartini]|uniref:Dehydrogenase n=1 Tax=Alkalicoccobacillus murimartini TaxID=171685 RepID=A0ABT9YI67_9BACI|nr:Gfo/Idh/MocA family oxidoreductase [Alkalicoccobacillus murimartini]MDQ0207211.1 putative dehydrogenase [Alkalicoccobacillus murimartini]
MGLQATIDDIIQSIDANRQIEEPFSFSVIGMDHPHIFGMVEGLCQAGATLHHVFDRDVKKQEKLLKAYPTAIAAESIEEVLEDSSEMIATSIIPAERAGLGLNVLKHDKHFFSAKAGFTTIEQVKQARKAVESSNKTWAIFYGERLGVESAVLAQHIVEKGLIGRVFQVTGSGPHRLKKETRDDWFFDPEQNGGILTDIGSHQIDQFLIYSGATDAKVLHSKTANYQHPEYGDWEDFGDATLLGNNGATQYVRVDWFTPDGLPTWGDGRTVLFGTDGYIELRKYVDVARSKEKDHLYIVTQTEELYVPVSGRVGKPYFYELLKDCQNGTEQAMSQEHVFRVAELAVEAQNQAVRLNGWEVEK